MRRIITVFVVLALMTALMVATALPAFARASSVHFQNKENTSSKKSSFKSSCSGEFKGLFC